LNVPKKIWQFLGLFLKEVYRILKHCLLLPLVWGLDVGYTRLNDLKEDLREVKKGITTKVKN